MPPSSEVVVVELGFESQPEHQLLRLGEELLVVRLFQNVYRELLLHLFLEQPLAVIAVLQLRDISRR